MADITLGYTPADAVAFDTAGWNTDMWSSFGGTSIYGELNGNIQDANLAAGEQVNARHIRQFEGFRAEWGGATDTQDWYQLVFADTYSTTAFIMLPGCARRMYIPWGAGTVNMFHVSAFASNFRIREASTPTPQDAEYIGGPTMYVAMFIDGEIATHTIRKLPTTWYPTNTTGAANSFYPRESVTTQHYDLVDCRDGIAAGWHDVAMGLIILPNTAVENIFPMYDTAVTAVAHTSMHRIRFGIRAASIVSLP